MEQNKDTAPIASPAALTLILEKLERFEVCAGDENGCDIGREWFDALTTLGLLERTQRSPALWSMTPAGEALLAAPPAAHSKEARHMVTGAAAADPRMEALAAAEKQVEEAAAGRRAVKGFAVEEIPEEVGIEDENDRNGAESVE